MCRIQLKLKNDITCASISVCNPRTSAGSSNLFVTLLLCVSIGGDVRERRRHQNQRNQRQKSMRRVKMVVFCPETSLHILET